MDEHHAAVLMEVAPREKRAEWHQKSIKRCLEYWSEERPEDYHQVVGSDDFGMLVGFQARGTTTGRYSYDAEFEFTPNFTSRELAPDVDEKDWALVKPFFEDWIECLIETVEEDQSASLLTAKELIAFFGSQHPKYNEKRIADALGVTVGTYRGKVGRAREKIEAARHTAALADSAEESDHELGSYQAPFTVLNRVDESRLPVDAASRFMGEDIRDVPVDMLIRD